MPTQYRLAPEVARLAGPLISDHHRHLVDLGYVRIEYVMRDEAATSQGRTIWGKARKVTGLNAFIAREETGVVDLVDPDPFFVIEIAEDIWVTLNSRQRLALVDHELSHLQVSENDKGEMVLALVGHDVEEFGEIVRRHGLYKKDVEHFAKVCSDQLSLLDAPGSSADDDDTGIAGDAEKFLRDEPGEGDGGE
jgi:Putative phage metallopeptidase